MKTQSYVNLSAIIPDEPVPDEPVPDEQPVTDEPGLDSSRWLSSPYILFNTIPPCASQTEMTAVKEEEWRESTFHEGKLVQRFCCQPLPKTSTEPHPFFNHQQSWRKGYHSLLCQLLDIRTLIQKYKHFL